jgi:hypothetical protein
MFGIWCIQIYILNVRTTAVQLSLDKNGYRRRRGLELLPDVWILHHDNAPAHKALSVKQFLAQNWLLKQNTRPVPLVWLRMSRGRLQKIKSALKGRIHQDIEDIQQMWRWHWKLFQTGVRKMFPTVAGSFVGLNAKLLKGSTLKVTPLSKL